MFLNFFCNFFYFWNFHWNNEKRSKLYWKKRLILSSQNSDFKLAFTENIFPSPSDKKYKNLPSSAHRCKSLQIHF